MVRAALSFVGLSANRSAPQLRAAYIATIAPGETPARAEDMAVMSGCALIVRAYMRKLGIRHERLDAPYRDRKAVEDVYSIGLQACAVRSCSPEEPPLPGDAVIVGGGEDGGGLEHVFIVTQATPAYFNERHVFLTSVDGGQRDSERYQCVLVKSRDWLNGWDHVEEGTDPGSGSRRKIRVVIDMARVVAKFAR